jgi:transcriptional regulator with XRE-family HTH domain
VWPREHIVPMEPFATRLRERARELDLSDAEVGRRAGLSERRYGNYVRGAREPDLATVLRICEVLEITPNDLLLASGLVSNSEQERWLSRLLATGRNLTTANLKLAVDLVEAVHKNSRRSGV